MMYWKAVTFGADHNLISAILSASHPREAKALGRKVPNFDEARWTLLSPEIVACGNYLKFEQNPHALEQLVRTDGTTLVEAAPWDRIWGIGLAADDHRAQRRETWLGLNKLGETQTRVRRTFTAVNRIAGFESAKNDPHTEA